MSFRMAVLLSITLLVGCQKPRMPGFIAKMTGKTPDVASDEVTPPRKTLESSAPSSIPLGEPYDSSDIQLTDFSNDTAPVELFGATVVATVNSEPIFADDVLQPHAANLAKAEQQLSPEEMNRLREKLIRQALPEHIKTALLISALRADISEEQFGQLTDQVDNFFEQEVEKLKARYKVQTKIELQRILEQQGTSLDSLNRSFEAVELSKYYISQNAKKDIRFSRQDLMEVYEQNKAQYEIEAAVKWQQIRVNIKPDGGQQEALKQLQLAIDALRNGEDFGAVARKYSNGPKRDSGGIWDWTKRGSLADEKVERALFEVPVGKISQPLESSTAYVIAKVLERRDAGYVPFEDVQDKINARMLSEARQNAAQDVIKNLNNTATIWTIFDGKPGTSG